MRILAASFTTYAAAAAAFGVLRRRCSNGHNLGIAALGRASNPAGPTTLVAGQFEEAMIAAAAGVMEDFGGTVVADVDERFTRS